MSTHRFSVGSRVGVLVGLLLLVLLPRAASPGPRDPLLPLLRRMNNYFHRHQVDGVTLDSRYAINPTEAIRLSVVSQLLAYTELYNVYPIRRFRLDIVQHGDYLLDRFDEINSGGPFDGMLGYGLLAAYEMTGDPRYLAKGTIVVDQLKALRSSDTILNGGLMAAMALAEYHRLTGDAQAGQRTREIVASLPPYQHRDASFPHWCACSKDIHYTAWMAMELILINRILDDPLIQPMLEKMYTFMQGRVDASGNTRYEEPCDEYPGCVVYYYSVATGCSIDYDTRAFTNELGYTALLFDYFRSPKYSAVMSFLHALETRGTFADKWDYWPPPDDPYYVWTSSDTSVVNMSLIFWSLASILGGRRDRTSDPYAWVPDDDDHEAGGAIGVARRPGNETLLASRRVQQVASSGGARVANRTRATVDSLLLAGADPASGCDQTSDPGAMGPADPTLGRPRPEPRQPAISSQAESSASAGARLGPILPNPARDACQIRFTVSVPASVSLAIYDVSGRLVRELVSAPLAAGEHEARWDRRDAAGAGSPSGLYLARLRVGEEVHAARIFVIR